MAKKAILVLADGSVYSGFGFGAGGNACDVDDELARVNLRLARPQRQGPVIEGRSVREAAVTGPDILGNNPTGLADGQARLVVQDKLTPGRQSRRGVVADGPSGVADRIGLVVRAVAAAVLAVRGPNNGIFDPGRDQLGGPDLRRQVMGRDVLAGASVGLAAAHDLPCHAQWKRPGAPRPVRMAAAEGRPRCGAYRHDPRRGTGRL